MEYELSKTIKRLLNKKGYYYHLEPDDLNRIMVILCINNKKMNIYIFINQNKITLQLHLPFSTEQFMSPLITLFIADYNCNKVFSKLHSDRKSGSIYYEYSFFTSIEEFNEVIFWKTLDTLISEANNNYTRLSHLATGLMNENQKQQYIGLLRKQIEKLEQKSIEDSVSYGDTTALL